MQYIFQDIYGLLLARKGDLMKILSFDFPEDWTSLELFPLADLHIGDPKTDVKLFQNFVKYIKEKPNRLVVFNGDGMNNALKSSVSNVYNETMNPNEQRKWLATELYPIKDRILCFVCGNHEYRSKKDTDLDPIEWIADSLGCRDKKGNLRYFEDEAALKITLGKDDHSKRIAYGIYMIHGAGGGRKPGSALNRAVDIALGVEGADVMIMSHVHKEIGHRFETRRMDLNNNVMRSMEKIIAISAPWQNFGGYAARFGLTPGCKGAEPIILSGVTKKARVMI